jgi:hypothetical protein
LSSIQTIIKYVDYLNQNNKKTNIKFKYLFNVNKCYVVDCYINSFNSSLRDTA